MADELHLPLSPDERDHLAAAAAARAQTPEQYAHDLIVEGIDGQFTRALASVRADLPELAAAQFPQEPRPGNDGDYDEAPMSSRDLRQDRNAA
jgi:hypothetical protein